VPPAIRPVLRLLFNDIASSRTSSGELAVRAVVPSGQVSARRIDEDRPSRLRLRVMRRANALSSGTRVAAFPHGSPAGYKPATRVAPVAVGVGPFPATGAEDISSLAKVRQGVEKAPSRWWVGHQIEHLPSSANYPVRFLKCSVGLRLQILGFKAPCEAARRVCVPHPGRTACWQLGGSLPPTAADRVENRGLGDEIASETRVWW